MKLRTLFPIALLAFVMLLLILSFNFRFRAAVFPAVLCSITGALLITQISRELAGKDTSAAEKPKGVKASEIRPFISGVAWAAGILPAMYIFGFVVGLPLYCLLYFKFHRQEWLRSIVASLFVFLLTYGGFQLGLKLQLYKGWLFLVFQ